MTKLRLLQNNKPDVVCFDSWIDAVDFFFKKSVEMGYITESNTKQELSKTFANTMQDNIKINENINGKDLYYIDMGYFLKDKMNEVNFA